MLALIIGSSTYAFTAVLVAVLILIWNPVTVDIAPFLLFLITVRASVAGSPVKARRSATCTR